MWHHGCHRNLGGGDGKWKPALGTQHFLGSLAVATSDLLGSSGRVSVAGSQWPGFSGRVPVAGSQWLGPGIWVRSSGGRIPSFWWLVPSGRVPADGF